jgi:signal peptidase I
MSDITQQPLPETPAKAKNQVSETGDFLRFLVKLALIVFVLRSFIFQPVSIPSESMVPRLLVGDYLIVSKWAYGYSTYSLWLPKSIRVMMGERAEFEDSEGSGKRIFGRAPERGDVAVFKAPPGNTTDYIKRVIGLPGDMVQMQDGVLFLNGVAVKRQRIADFIVPVSPNTRCDKPTMQETASNGSLRCRYPRYQETLPGGKSYNVIDMGVSEKDTTDIYTVPDGHFFAMGDNRDRSADSRFPAVEGAGIGIVPQENLVGRAWFMIFSTDGSASYFNPISWFTAARGSRIGESI